jgi:predicted dehydrogenase
MNEATSLTSRREFIKTSTRIAAAGALAGVAVPYVHAAGNETIQVALIGCGGRGTGAVYNALSVKSVPVKLVAMADVFQNRLDDSYSDLSKNRSAQVDVPPERRFIGFDGYRKAMDCLKPGDIVILTTPLAFRWVHFPYAIEKKLNVFMEKPLCADGPSARKMLALAEQATANNLKVGVGLMSRHTRSLEELAKRAHDGELGQIILMRGYRMSGPGGSAFSERYPGGATSELLWQISRFHSFIWASGGCFNDFYIHIVDHLCWIKNAWPVSAQALGGRHYKKSPEGKWYVDQNFDSYSVEYTFADGTKMLMDGRCVTGAKEIYSSYAHGTKGMAVASAGGDCGFPSSIHSAQFANPGNATWTSREIPGQQDPYENEWNDLVDAIRNDKPYNECPRGVQASLVSNMGRMAAHSAQEISYDDALNQVEAYAPDADKMTMDSPPPLASNADGFYPIPKPGQLGKREYEIS